MVFRQLAKYRRFFIQLFMLGILVVDGERSFRNSLRERLEYEGYVVDTAETGDEAVSKIDHKPFNVVLCDMGIQHCDAYDLLTKVHAKIPLLPFIMLSSLKGVDTAVHIMRHGAYDYLAKPIDLNKLLASIRETQTAKEEIREKIHPEPGLGSVRTSTSASTVKASGTPPHTEIIGQSQAIEHVKQLIAKIAPSEARVLILGDNGTGKELVAHALHEQSHRANGPFIEVNCAAIPSELIESELFGHEKGAFTSAIRQRKGKFEQADRGTLFLDEIGDMSLSAQAKVLRALQEHRITRVGSDKDIDIDVRVIAATNKNLQREIAEGHFREDLYHRLSVILIRVPALKDRIDDLPLLVDYFIHQICDEYHIPPKAIEPQAIEALMKLEWTGNIRELRNVVERLVILSGDTIGMEEVEAYALGVS